MKNFEFSFGYVLSSFNILASLLEDEKRVPFVRIDNLSQIVVPKGAMFADDFKQVFKTDNHDNTVVTLDIFDIYEIVNTEKPNHIHIYSSPRLGSISIDVFVNFGERKSVARILEEYPKFVRSDYEFLIDFLPFDISRKGHEMWYKTNLAISWVVSFSIATLSLLYALYNLDNCKIEGEVGGDVKPVMEYISRVANKVKNMGRDFYECIENLKVLGGLL